MNPAEERFSARFLKRCRCVCCDQQLVAVAQEAIPIQIVSAESAVEPMVKDQQAETKDASDRPAAEEETPADRPEEDIVSVEQRVDESAVEVSGVDVVDPETVVQQVLNQLDFSTEGQDVAKGDRVETWFDRALAEEFATAGDDSPTEKVNDEEIPWFVRPFLSADHDNERLFETESDSADTMDFEVHSQTLPVVRDTNVDPAGEQEIPVFEEQLVDSVNEEDVRVYAQLANLWHSRTDNQLNVLSTRRGFREVRLPKSQQGSNRGFPMLRGKTVILQFRLCSNLCYPLLICSKLVAFELNFPKLICSTLNSPKRVRFFDLIRSSEMINSSRRI
ncbi:hypothetical protein F511_23973 [Dorcoceras hygrometricum]|uniref:Uncharacterized protein n=1 Tax=Dorcoceras hygrometricum TaxID=472368 RepID=A0A2Z7AQ94_9LAMI|nr:hypothetical protein F511_23973 [Dorcoceras hygrometricum]